VTLSHQCWTSMAPACAPYFSDAGTLSSTVATTDANGEARVGRTESRNQRHCSGAKSATSRYW
jgi:hypothetical protein